MGNNTSLNPWVLDSTGVITSRPVIIKYARLDPNAVSDTAIIRHWNPSITKSTQTMVPAAVSSSSIITSSGLFTSSNVSAGDIIKITYSDSLNKGTYLVASVAANDSITIEPAILDDESGKTYSWEIYTGRIFHEFRVNEDSLISDDFLPPEPVSTMQGFALDSLTSSAVLYVYV